MSGGENLKTSITNDADNIIYVYDGGLAGFFCCVYESVYGRQIPYAIVTEKDFQPTLLPYKHIETDRVKAKKVRDSIPVKISSHALDLIETVFLSCLEEKEIAISRFLLKGYRVGGKIVNMMGDPIVEKLLKAERHMMGECRLLLGFVRFSDYDGRLAATISPKNFVLPYISGHFVNRFSGEDFMIYDKTHRVAFIYEEGKRRLLEIDFIDFPEVSEEEDRYRSMWKHFYNTVSIEARENPRCRMTHMPKRYWENMLEVKELL